MDVDSLSGEIGKCLQWLRKSLLLTQYQLASFTELDYRHYQNIESGRVEVKVETLKRICLSFGIGLSTFFYLMDRKPWANESFSKNRGSGELYLYRMILEQAKFRLLPTVRDHVSEWGRSIAEGNRDNLKDCSKPCLEVDADFKILWKNNAAEFVLVNGDRDLTQLISSSHIESVRDAAQEFALSKSNSFYIEVPLHRDHSANGKTVAIIGLRPMIARPEQTLFVSLVEIEGNEEVTGQDDMALALRDANRIFM